MFLVIQKFINGNTSCYVESLSDHGSIQELPCLQIYVTPLSDEDEAVETDSAASHKIKDNMRTDLERLNNLKMSPEDNVRDGCGANCSGLAAKNSQNILLLFQNEYNYAGSDDLYRRCSYLPKFCSNDIKALVSDICAYAYQVGDRNETIKCFYDPQNQRVIKDKKIHVSNIVHSLLWPSLGIILSTLCCIGFWNHNYKHISRLYIYNSWSAS